MARRYIVNATDQLVWMRPTRTKPGTWIRMIGDEYPDTHFPFFNEPTARREAVRLHGLHPGDDIRVVDRAGLYAVLDVVDKTPEPVRETAPRRPRRTRPIAMGFTVSPVLF